MLACSTVHLYLTVPFVLSWSLLEAMAAGCAIVASATPPVQEVLAHERSALLVDFFDVDAMVAAVLKLLGEPPLRQRLATRAQQRSKIYGCKRGLSSWAALLSAEPLEGILTKRHKPVGG